MKPLTLARSALQAALGALATLCWLICAALMLGVLLLLTLVSRIHYASGGAADRMRALLRRGA